LRLYLQDNAQPGDIEKLITKVESDGAVDKAKLISKEEALQEFKISLGEQSTLIEGLEQENPLPASVEVRFKKSDSMHQAMQQFVESYRNEPQVQHVQYSEGVLGEIAKLLRSFKLLGSIAMAFMFSSHLL